jgi:hypothetical protein
MRIFIAVRHSTDPRYFYGGLWSGNFYPALRQLGHEIVESQVDLLPLSYFMDVPANFTREELARRAQVTEEILAEVRRAHHERPLDLFLSYFYNAHFDPAGFEELRTLGIRSLNFYCNSVPQFELVAEIAAKADFSWHPERAARSKYLAVGARPVWVQMGADPKIYRPVESAERQRSVCFVGQRYADRDRWLAALSSAGVPLDIYGAGWEAEAAESAGTAAPADPVYLGRNYYPPSTPMSYARAVRANLQRSGLAKGLMQTARQWRYRRETQRLLTQLAPHTKGRAGDIATTLGAYEICLNLSNVWTSGPGSALIPHVRLRDFEGPMCGACYLTGHTDEIEEFYELGKEVETYRTTEELIEKSQFLLAHPDAAERLRRAGFLRARRDHQWTNRFQALFAKIGSS